MIEYDINTIHLLTLKSPSITHPAKIYQILYSTYTYNDQL